MKNIKILEDVTNEFLARSTPNCGHILFEKGFNFKRNKEEEKTARWLFKTFGGDILVLKEKNEYQLINPDFEWNTKFWELKNVSSARSVDNSVRKAFKQIHNNPGGIIIDIQNCTIKLDILVNVITNKLNRYRSKNLYIIIKNNNKLVKVLKKK